MSLLEPLAPFVDNVGQIISAADLATMQKNVRLVDSLTYRRTPAFDSSATNVTNTPGFVQPSTDGYTHWRIWKGAIRWQTGVTTLTFAGTAVRSTLGGSNEVLNCYVGGVLATAITPAGAFSVPVSFTGYTDGQIVGIEVRLGGTTWGSDGVYVFHAIYASPISYTVTGWPGVPTFSSAYTAAQLNQIVSAYTWLYNRMAAVPLVAGLAQVYAQGPFNIAGNLTANGTPLYYGAVLRGYTEDTLTIYIQVVNATTPGLRYKIFLNGGLVATGPTWGPGTQIATEVISLASVTVGNRAEVVIYTQVVTEAANRADWTFNYWTISGVRSQPDYGSGLAYPAANVGTLPLGDGLIPPSTLNTFLNFLTSALNSAKARVDANTSVWARSYAMRQRFSRGDNMVNIDYEEHRSRPRLVRLSDRLLVSGKNVAVGYGAITVPTDDRGPLYQSYKHFKEESAIDGDKLETKIVYLDSMQGLFQGTAYFLTGSIDYAAELL